MEWSGNRVTPGGLAAGPAIAADIPVMRYTVALSLASSTTCRVSTAW